MVAREDLELGRFYRVVAHPGPREGEETPRYHVGRVGRFIRDDHDLFPFLLEFSPGGVGRSYEHGFFVEHELERVLDDCAEVLPWVLVEITR
jgi:hypothetical protein